MTQTEVRDIVKAASETVGAAYWTSTDPAVKSTLGALVRPLGDVLTILDQEELDSRSAAFTQAAKTMKDEVVPMLHKLDQSVARLIKVDDDTKQTLSAAMQLSSAVSFFKIPGI